MSSLRRFLSFRLNRLATLMVGLFLVVAVAAPWLAPPDDPNNPSMFRYLSGRIDRTPKPPNEQALLGTVAQIPRLPRFGIQPGQQIAYQWDVYYTVIWGARSALRFGLTVTLPTAAIGVFIGLISGYLGGWVNSLLMRLTDAFLAFPVIAAVWIFDRMWFANIYSPWSATPDFVFTPWEQFLRRTELDPVSMAIVLFAWMPYARLVNTLVSRLKHEDYVMAAQALGAGRLRVIFRHVLPNALAPVIVLAARDVGGLVILASAFTFIGIGGNVAWGIMLVASKDYILGVGGNPLTYWWTFVPVSLALILFSVSWNLLGDGLNAFLNPRATHVTRR